MTEALVHVVHRGAVAEATLARAPVNAMNDALVDQLLATIDQAEADPGVTVLHLRSAHKVFCAGADLALMQHSLGSDDGLQHMLALVQRMQLLATRLESSPLVTLAEIGGAALGGGFELALGCDLRIAANEARLGLPEVGLGLLAAAGGTQRLTQLVGPGLARRLILGAETPRGTVALALGLVQWAVPRADLPAQARALADRLAALPRHALAAAKQCLQVAQRLQLEGYALELTLTRQLYRHPDTRQRVADFLARSAPNADLSRSTS